MGDEYGAAPIDDMDELIDAADDEFAEFDEFDEADDWEQDDWEPDDHTTAFWGALHERYDDAAPEDVEDALLDVLDSLSPAEAFSFDKALGLIGQAARSPAARQAAVAALPVAGGAAGTLIGGPAGTLVGAGLGKAAAGALSSGGVPGAPPTARAAPAAPVATMPSMVTTVPAGAGAANPPGTGAPPPVPASGALAKAPVTDGSTAAVQALMLANDPALLRSLVAVALGENGRRSIDGKSAGAWLNLLSSVLGQAAADADELLWESSAVPGYLLDEQSDPQVDETEDWR